MMSLPVMEALHVSVGIEHILDNALIPRGVPHTSEGLREWLRIEPEHLLWLFEAGLVRIDIEPLI